MANIKLGIDVTGNVLQILKEAKSMGDDVIKTAQDISKSLGDISAPNVSNISKEVDDVSSSLGDASTEAQAFASSLGDISPEKFVNAETNVSSLGQKLGDLKNIAVDTGSSISKSLTDGVSSIEGTFSNSISSIGSKLGNLKTNFTEVASSAAQSFSSAASSSGTINKAVDGVVSVLGKIKTAAADTGASLSKGLSDGVSAAGDLVNSLSGVDGAIAGVMGAIGTQNIGELIFGNSMKAEVNQVLLKNMTQTAKGAKELYNVVDTATNSTLVSMQSVIPALNKFQASTGATQDSLMTITPQVSNFGSYVYAMTGSAALADTAMMDLSKGLDGLYASLDQYGITEKSLMDTGLWSGKKDDVVGYMKAVEAVIGPTDELMNTTQGVITTIGKKFSVAGKKIGEDILPVIKKIAEGFINLNNATGGNLAKALLIVAGAITAVITVAGFLGALLPFISTGFGMLGITSFISTVKIFGLSGALKLLSMDLYLVAAGVWASLAPLLPFIAAIALIAIGIQELGKYMGWWTDWGTMIDAFSGGIQRLWSAFVNSPQVIAFIDGLKQAWASLVSSLQPVIGWFQKLWAIIFPPIEGEVDVVRIIIDDFGEFASAVGQVVNAIAPFAGFIFNVLTLPLQTLLAVIGPVIMFLANFISSLMQLFQGEINVEEFFSSISEAFNTLLISLEENSANIATTLIDSFLNAFLSLGQQIWVAWDTNVTQPFMEWLTGIPEWIANGLIDVVMAVVTWGIQLKEEAHKTGSNFVNNIINFIKTLPSKIGSFLVQVVGRIISAGASWISNAKTKAQAVVSGVIDYIKQLPQKVYNEFINIGKKILSAGSDLVNKAKDVGKNIVDGIMNAMGIHSPGTIQEKITAEFQALPGRIISVASSAMEAAKTVGSSITSGFGNPSMEVGFSNTENMVLPTQTLENPIDYSATEQGFNEMTGIITTATGTINSALGNVKSTYSGLTTGILESTVSLDANNVVVADSFYSLETSVTGALNNIADSNSSNWSNINASTSNHLKNIYSSTDTITKQMSTAWNGMKDKINTAANNIKTQSTSHFNSLSKTIGSFYGNLQNPSRWGAGPAIKTGAGGRSTRTGSALSGISSLLNKRMTIPKEKITLREVASSSCVNKDCLDYTGLSNKHRLNMSDLVDSECLTCKVKMGAGWLDSVSSNTSKIKNTSNNWGMKGPIVANKYSTGLSFKVKDFISGSPKIGFESFKSMAESIFSDIDYDYYFNSEKYGSWLNAFNVGKMNCSDGTDALIALAQTCGLPASKVHGHWGSVGHFWANIAGHKMDTTGFTLGKGWTPAQSHAGPPPKSSFSVEGIFEAIYDVLKDLYSSYKSDEQNVARDTNSGKLFDTQTGQTIVSGDTHVHLNHTTKINIPESVGNSIDEEKLAKLICKEQEKQMNDPQYLNKIKQLIKADENRNRRFGSA